MRTTDRLYEFFGDPRVAIALLLLFGFLVLAHARA